jgi:hypothetical protein
MLLVAVLGCRGSQATPEQPPAEKADLERAAVAALIGTTPPEWQVEHAG